MSVRRLAPAEIQPNARQSVAVSMALAAWTVSSTSRKPPVRDSFSNNIPNINRPMDTRVGMSLGPTLA